MQGTLGLSRSWMPFLVFPWGVCLAQMLFNSKEYKD